MEGIKNSFEKAPLDENLLRYAGLSAESAGPLKEQVVRVGDLIPGIATDGLISLDHFPADIPEDKDRYEGRVMEGSSISIPYSMDVLRYLRNLSESDATAFESLRQNFRDSVVVDIGAGAGVGLTPNGYIIASMLEAKGYIGVEPFNQADLIRVFFEVTDSDRAELIFGGNARRPFDTEKSPIPFNLVVEDALTFLKRLPEGSVSLLSAGIADEVIGSREYYSELEAETARVLGEGKMCLVSNSVIPEGLFNKEHISVDTGHFMGTGERDNHGPVLIVKK